MKKILIMLLLCSIVLAQAGIERTNIVISISQTGAASVREEFIIRVNNETATIFEQMIEKKESTFDSWKALISDLDQHVKSLEPPVISAKKTELTRDLIEYKLGMEYNSPVFAQLKSSEGRIENWEVQNMMLEFYDLTSEKLIISEEISITIVIDDTRKDKTISSSEFFSITPKSIVQGPYMQDGDKAVFFINGPALAENFKINFKIEKPLSQVFAVQNVVDFFKRNPGYTLILVILIALTIVFRKQVFSLVEDAFITDEDIILPRDRQ